MKKNLSRQAILGGFLLVSILGIFAGLFFFKPTETKAGNFTSGSATMSNSRFSYRASVGTGNSAGSSVVTIDTGDADQNTNHLFPGDAVCFGNAALSGCIDNKTYAVSSIASSTSFNLTTALSSALVTTDYAITTQSGTLTITLVNASQIPANGDILVTIPAVNTSAKENDKFPDTNSSTSTSGFDLGGLTASDVSVTGCTDANWNTTETITAGSNPNDATIEINRQNSICGTGTTITITIGSTNKLINPAPINTGHTQGQADVYQINIKSRDGSNNTLDESDVVVAPIEAVFVSATVDETLTFTVAGRGVGTTNCGVPASVASTAYSIPWGTVTTETFYNAAQALTVGTNASGGYAVTIEQNDQMGKAGNVCTGTGPAADGYTFGSNHCIRDNIGDGTLDYTNSDDCKTATVNGTCFSQQSVSGSQTLAVAYNVQTNSCDGSPTFCARVPADAESSETPQTIFSYNDPASADQTYVCYRISVDASQPAGYYYNKVKYTATPTF